MQADLDHCPPLPYDGGMEGNQIPAAGGATLAIDSLEPPSPARSGSKAWASIFTDASGSWRLDPGESVRSCAAPARTT